MIAEPGDTCKICGTVYTEYTGICGFCGGVEKLRAEIDALREQVARLTAERDAASASREYLSILYGEAMVQLNRHRELTARINSDLWANKSRSQEWERRARWLLVEAKFYRFEFKRIRENRDFWRRLESQVELRMFKSE